MLNQTIANHMKISHLITIGSLVLTTACEPRDTVSGAPAKPWENALKEIRAQQQTAKQQAPKPSPVTKPASPINSMVGINATNQGYAMLSPWNKNEPQYSYGFGIYLGDGNFLTTANIVYSNSFLEITSADGSQTVSAVVTAFDPEADLALIRLKNEQKDAAFLKDLVPVKIGNAPKLGDEVKLWQFNDDGLPIITDGRLLATESGCPFTMCEPFVLYNVKSSVTALRGGGSNPIMVGDTLVGISTNIQPTNQKVLSLTTPLIKTFLKQAQSGKYVGFPTDGAEVTPLTDPVFRKYLGLPETGGGLYVANLPEASSFYQAGVRKGDVIETINDQVIDSRGLIKDANLGPVSANFLFRDTAVPGDTITLKIKRKNTQGISEPHTIKAKLNRDSVDKDIINQNPFISEPTYRIYGGLVFMPITQAFLNDLGAMAKSNLPNTIRRTLNDKEKLKKEGVTEPVVLLSALPTPATLGYTQMTLSVVKKINGVNIRNLAHLNELLDKPGTEDIQTIEITEAPYTLYMSKKAAAQADFFIQMRAIPKLRRD